MTSTAPAPRRLHYFDMMKGIAIFMVVMGHVLTMCVRDIDRAFIFKLIGEVHMPLFFFISGWFSMRRDAEGRISAPRLWQRAKQLLVPMVVVSTIWMVYYPHSGLQSPLDATLKGTWSSEWKNGYWFTLVLFEIIVMYAAFVPLLRRIKSAVGACVALALVWAALIVATQFIPEKYMLISSLGLAVQFFAAFTAGAIARRHAEGFGRLVANGWVFTASLLVAGVLIYYVCYYWEFPSIPKVMLIVGRGLMHVALALVAIAVIKPWSEQAFAPDAPAGSHRLARMWTYIGTQSLAIYLLHYFFLFPMGCVRQALIDLGLGFTPLLALALVVAAVIVAVTLGANYIISKSPILAWLLTGKTK